jgi:hypothetical protein|tara:strand:- start:1333 stop:1785 length:453 start_codon:yes stop_codon:yes gene_type:complete
MAEQRTKRDAESREVEQRPSDSWIPASVLPNPDPQEGWVFRWVRTSTLGHADNTNVSQKFREGWVPVKAEDHPELEVMSDIDSRFKGNIEIGGLLLCKAPEAKVRQREDYFEQMASTQMESVDNNFLKQNDPRMPVLNPERSTRTTFGRS